MNPGLTRGRTCKELTLIKLLLFPWLCMYTNKSLSPEVLLSPFHREEPKTRVRGDWPKVTQVTELDTTPTYLTPSTGK